MAAEDAELTPKAKPVRQLDLALPPRRETFLARYPRNFKLAVVTIIFAALMLGPLVQKRLTTPREDIAAHRVSAATPNTPAQQTHQEKTQAKDEAGGRAESMNTVALNDQNDRNIKLATAPDPALSEDTEQGSLPRISDDGRQPWQVYARPFDLADKRPRIAIVISDLGLSRAISDAVINNLPPTITLAFSTQTHAVGGWCNRARQDGHEVLISVPMEPFDYPRSDPGPNTLLTSLPNSDNLQRLHIAMRSSTGYVGITTLSGSHFTTDPKKMRPILTALKERGLMVFDAGVAPHSVITDLAKYAHVPAAAVTLHVDDNLAPAAIDKALQHLEQQARIDGRAIGVAAPTPVVIERLRAWTQDLPNRGIALAPLSAMAQ